MKIKKTDELPLKNINFKFLFYEKRYEIMGVFGGFCHLHSKYQKQPHSVIYFWKDTVEGYLNLYNRYASVFTYLKKCKNK